MTRCGAWTHQGAWTHHRGWARRLPPALRGATARRIASFLFAAALLPVAVLIGCGVDFRSSPPAPPDDQAATAAELLDIYDVWVEIPDLLLPGRSLPATLAVDLEITFGGDPLLQGGSGTSDGLTVGGTLANVDGTVAAAGAGATEAGGAAGPGVARVRLVGQFLDGTPIALPATRAWEIDFARLEDDLNLDPIEPFAVQDVTDSLRLELTLADGGRRMTGTAALVLLGRAGTARATRQRNYLAATTDFQFGGTVARVRARYDSQLTIFQDVEDAWVDPIVRVEDGSAFLVNRFELILSEEDDNRHVEWLSPAEGYRTIFSFSLGDGANPQDLVIDGRQRLWASRYEPPYSDLLIVDPRTGERLGRIDLTAWVTGTDLLPRPDQMIRVGDEIFVTLQNANLAFSVYGPARMLVIDTVSDTVSGVIELEGTNPFQGLERDPASGLLYLAMAGIFPGQQQEQFTGGVEVIDPRARASLGLRVDDDDLGGHPNDVAIASASKGYVLVSRRSGSDFLTDVVAFDPRDGTILGTVYSGGAGGRLQVADLEADGEGWLLLALRDPLDSGIQILDTATDLPLPGGRLRTSLFVSSLASLRGAR